MVSILFLEGPSATTVRTCWPPEIPRGATSLLGAGARFDTIPQDSRSGPTHFSRNAFVWGQQTANVTPGLSRGCRLAASHTQLCPRRRDGGALWEQAVPLRLPQKPTLVQPWLEGPEWRSSPPEVPPLLVVHVLFDGAIKDLPAKQVHQVGEGDKGDLLQGNAHQEIDLLLWRKRRGGSQEAALVPPPLGLAPGGPRPGILLVPITFVLVLLAEQASVEQVLVGGG